MSPSPVVASGVSPSLVAASVVSPSLVAANGVSLVAGPVGCCVLVSVSGC